MSVIKPLLIGTPTQSVSQQACQPIRKVKLHQYYLQNVRKISQITVKVQQKGSCMREITLLNYSDASVFKWHFTVVAGRGIAGCNYFHLYKIK